MSICPLVGLFGLNLGNIELWWCGRIFLCVCVCVCVNMHVRLHACVHMHVWQEFLPSLLP